MNIHLIEKDNRITRADKSSQQWQSGYWKLTEQVAKELVGGELYLHKAKRKASYFGGVIDHYHVQTEGPFKGRIVFTFTASMQFKNVKTSFEGWGMEKKIVR